MIQLVIHALTTRKPLTGSQSLIVDYQGIPVLYNKDGEALLSDDMAALGEADVKFVRYCDMYRNLQVDSVGPLGVLHPAGAACLAQCLVES